MNKITRRIISTPNAPRPVAPYNQAVCVDNTVYVSGCLGIDKEHMNLVPGGASAEARQALINMNNVLEAAGSSLNKVVKTTILLNDINEFANVNKVYEEFFKPPYPARTAYQVGKLPLGAQVEIEAVAVLGEIVDSV